MRLTSLRVQHVRTHERFELELSPEVTLITGLNGSGKTSLLESIYISLQGSSFKGSDSEVLQYDKPWYRIDVQLNDGTNRTVKFDSLRTTSKKQFEIEGKINYRLPYSSKYPVVLFEPDELRLISGSPSRRRQFIDRFISQFNPEYATSLRRYERALRQRNNILKHRGANDDLFVWDVILSRYGAYIIQCRTKLLHQLQPLLETTYREISSTDDAVSITYSYTSSGITEQKLLSELHQSAERDKILGYTSVGPHRHDIIFSLNGNPAASAASRGETRTIVLALKFLEVDTLHEATRKPPIILLDDVFSELDEPRQQALMRHFSSYQTIITSVAAATTEYMVIELSD